MQSLLCDRAHRHLQIVATTAEYMNNADSLHAPGACLKPDFSLRHQKNTHCLKPYTVQLLSFTDMTIDF